MDLTLIAAIGSNHELGYQNQLIWKFKQDMHFFKDQTMGKPIIMGRKTFESLPRLLPGREHFVLTSHDLDIEGVRVFHSKEELFDFIQRFPKEYMVIGGASIYQEFLSDANKMLLTEIYSSAPADVYFPTFHKQDWERVVLEQNMEKNIPFDFVEYTRKLKK